MGLTEHLQNPYTAHSGAETAVEKCGGEDSMALITATGQRKAAFAAFVKMAVSGGLKVG